MIFTKYQKVVQATVDNNKYFLFDMVTFKGKKSYYCTYWGLKKNVLSALITVIEQVKSSI